MKLHLSILLSLLAFSVFAQKTVQTNGNQTVWGQKTWVDNANFSADVNIAGDETNGTVTTTSITLPATPVTLLATNFGSTNGLVINVDGTDYYFGSDGSFGFSTGFGQPTYVRATALVSGGSIYQGGVLWTRSGDIITLKNSSSTSTNIELVLSRITVITNLTMNGEWAYIQYNNSGASNPPPSSATTATIFSATNAGTLEIFTQDGAGNITQISPHAADAPASLLELTDEMPMVTKEYNQYTGTARWINYSRAARRLEQLEEAVQWLFTQVNTNGLGLQTRERIQKILDLTTDQMQIVYVVTNYVAPVSWTSVQNQIQADYATSYTNALDAYNQAVLDGDTNAVPPVYNPPAIEPVPAWLAERGVQ